VGNALVLIAEYTNILVTAEPYIGYRRFAILTVVSVFLVILAGGVVRTTGSGMGCPDWPKCFGKIIPPTKESELPLDYKTRYMVKGKLAEFNVQKTWIEYINRLIGALTGIFILIAFVLSLRFKEDRQVAVYSGLGLVFVLFEAVLGKLTVDEHLKPIIVSLHFWGAIAVILSVLYAVTRLFRSSFISQNWKPISSANKWIWGLILLTICQMLLGSQVRQAIDEISFTLGFDQRNNWIEKLEETNIGFFIHRLVAYAVIGLLVYLFWKVIVNPPLPIKRIGWILGGTLAVEFIGGLIMAEVDIPALIQPLHMLASTVFISFLFQLLWVVNFNKK
jgi:cytochrome c oxidase assembly protein subunit 15